MQNLNYFLKNEVCDGCAKSENSPKIQPLKLSLDLTKSTVESVLIEVNNKLEILFNLKIQLEELRDTVDFYSEQYQEMSEFKESAQKRITALENKNIYLQKTNESLEERIAFLELKEVENEIEIVGLHQAEKEDTKQTIMLIAEKLQLKPNDIVDAKRVGREKTNDNRPLPRPIVVKLKTVQAKSEWLMQKKIRHTNKSLLSINNEHPIYNK